MVFGPGNENLCYFVFEFWLFEFILEGNYIWSWTFISLLRANQNKYFKIKLYFLINDDSLLILALLVSIF